MQLDISNKTTLFFKAEGAGGYGRGAIIHGVVLNDKKAVALISIKVDDTIAEKVVQDIAMGAPSTQGGVGTLVSIEMMDADGVFDES